MRDLSAVWLIYRQHLRTSLRSLRTWICALLCLAPTAISLAAGGRIDAVDLAGGTGAMLLLQVLTPLVGLVLGSAVVTEEVEARTITYVFTRPVGRSAFFLGRWLATGTVVGGLLVLSATGLTWSAATQPLQLRPPRSTWKVEVERNVGWMQRETGHRRGLLLELEDGDHTWFHVGRIAEGEVRELPNDPRGRRRRLVGTGPMRVDKDLPGSLFPRLALGALLGGLFFSLLTAGLGIFFKRPVIFGLAYAFAVEGVLANIPGSTQALSLQYHLRSVLVDPEVPFWGRFEFLQGTEFLAWGPAALRVLLLLLLGLGFCAWAIRRRQFVLTS